MFTLAVANLILIILFIFIPHTVELTEVIDTWFPYKGLVMYKDFPITHTPLGRFLIVPLHLLSNWNLEVDPFLGLAIGILSLYVLYIFGKRFLSKRGTQISLIFFTIFYWYYATSIMYFHEMFIGLTLAIALFFYYKIHEEQKI